jgi:preprotein translocase subunit SecG
MLAFLTSVHVLLCVFMIFVILLQPGKDAGMGAALGGGAATSAFGGRGAVTFLSRVTAVCAALFFLTSLTLSFQGMRTSVAARAAAKPVTPVTQPSPTPSPAASDVPSVPSAPTAAPK